MHNVLLYPRSQPAVKPRTADDRLDHDEDQTTMDRRMAPCTGPWISSAEVWGGKVVRRTEITVCNFCTEKNKLQF